MALPKLVDYIFASGKPEGPQPHGPLNVQDSGRVTPLLVCFYLGTRDASEVVQVRGFVLHGYITVDWLALHTAWRRACIGVVGYFQGHQWRPGVVRHLERQPCDDAFITTTIVALEWSAEMVYTSDCAPALRMFRDFQIEFGGNRAGLQCTIVWARWRILSASICRCAEQVVRTITRFAHLCTKALRAKRAQLRGKLVGALEDLSPVPLGEAMKSRLEKLAGSRWKVDLIGVSGAVRCISSYQRIQSQKSNDIIFEVPRFAFRPAVQERGMDTAAGVCDGKVLGTHHTTGFVREVAFSEFAGKAGYKDMVPETKYTHLKFRAPGRPLIDEVGSATVWVNHAVVASEVFGGTSGVGEEKPADPFQCYLPRGQHLSRGCFLDIRLGHLDRHFGNALFRFDALGEFLESVHLIDNELCFPEVYLPYPSQLALYTSLPEYREPVSPKVLEEVKNVRFADILFQVQKSFGFPWSVCLLLCLIDAYLMRKVEKALADPAGKTLEFFVEAFLDEEGDNGSAFFRAVQSALPSRVRSVADIKHDFKNSLPAPDADGASLVIAETSPFASPQRSPSTAYSPTQEPTVRPQRLFSSPAYSSSQASSSLLASPGNASSQACSSGRVPFTSKFVGVEKLRLRKWLGVRAFVPGWPSSEADCRAALRSAVEQWHSI